MRGAEVATGHFLQLYNKIFEFFMQTVVRENLKKSMKILQSVKHNCA